MRGVQILGFCAGCLVATAAVTALVFPHAAMSRDQRANLDAPRPPGSEDRIDLGRIYGKVPVLSLLEAYQAKAASRPAGGAADLPQFGGC